MASAAVVAALEHFKVEGLQIKFVNDVFLNDKKICGVLCKSESVGENFKLMMGIGINLNTTKEQYESVPTASSILIETKQKIDVQEYA